MALFFSNLLFFVVLYIIGVVITVRRSTHEDVGAYTVIAILSPVVILLASASSVKTMLTGRFVAIPCPDGLEEAEFLVEQQRQRLYGGEHKKSFYAARWQQTYEFELQRAQAKVLRVTHQDSSSELG